MSSEHLQTYPEILQERIRALTAERDRLRELLRCAYQHVCCTIPGLCEHCDVCEEMARIRVAIKAEGIE